MTVTKQQLLLTAQTLEIVGRHEMSKDALEARVLEIWLDALDTHEDSKVVHQVNPVTQDDNTPVLEIRVPRGQSGNKPWVRKFYYVDLMRYGAAKASGDLGKAPLQVQLMLKSMVKHGTVMAHLAKQGGPIAELAVDSGDLSTKCVPAELFAYYRKRMEGLGLRLA